MKQRIFTPILLILGLISFVEAAAEAANRPNILLIAVDDMAYSDIGPFGSEIRTPSIDALAQSGVKFTNFYVGPSCSPTRSMLFSGNDNHVAGLGNMGELLAPNQVGKPSYEGHLNNRVVSIATLLKSAGYQTYMAGKWHLGHEPDQDPSKRGSRIAQGAGWAQASSTPFHLFKNFLAEGGIRSPLIISGPGVAHKGEVSNSVAHVMDIAPTLLELSGASYPQTFDGKPVEQQRGKSMVAHLSDKSQTVRGPDDAIGWEYNNLKALRQGNYKATWISKPYGPGDWQIFDLSVDPGESKDLSMQQPELRQRLIAAWKDYAKQVGVIPPDVDLFAKE